MKENLFKLDKDSDECWITEITTTDGVYAWQKFRKGMYEEEILRHLLQLKHYTAYKGDWQIIFCQDGAKFTEKDFSKLIERAIRYIDLRDNKDDIYF